MHVALLLIPGVKMVTPLVMWQRRRSTAGSCLLCFCPHRVSPPHERGAGRSGRVYLLTGHLWPGEQWLGQLLYQTGALRTTMGRSKTDRHGIPPVRIVHAEPLMWREQYCYFVAVRAHNPKTFVMEVLKESTQGRAGVTHIRAFSL